jgi:hypothetical protein
MTFVLGTCNSVEQLGITKRSAAILWGTATTHFDEARIEHAGFGIDEPLDHNRVLPSIAEVVEVDEFLRVDVF